MKRLFYETKFLFWPKPPNFGHVQLKWGQKPGKMVHSCPRWTNNGLNWSKYVQHWVFSAHGIFQERQYMFCGKCGIPFSRGEWTRDFELLFVAFYSRIVSTYLWGRRVQNAPGGTFFMEYSLLFLGGRHDYNTTRHISTNIWNWRNLKIFPWSVDQNLQSEAWK